MNERETNHPPIFTPYILFGREAIAPINDSKRIERQGSKDSMIEEGSSSTGLKCGSNSLNIAIETH